MDIRTVAFCLLMERLLSMLFIVGVISLQAGLFKKEASPVIKTQRKVLFAISVIVFLGNLVAIVVDSATLLDVVTRNHPTPLGVIYSMSNATTAVLQSGAFYLLYWIAKRSLKEAE